ncbi:MAG: allantoin permease [Castellaniella sp.]|uniref:purine-cytosine permease family protein n=1 Tax=Castellaniella sp. TaxID=1955812 RepID=UPI002A360AA4|nr:allantoin permease [Castellaniella sp.]MDY0309959.1 allantoin permease [Castellaniella sp.]
MTTPTQGAAQAVAEEIAGAIPARSRMGPLGLTMAWWGVCSAMFYIVVAASLAHQFGTLNAIIGITLSVLTYGVINSFMARYAIRTGLSVALFSRVLFGNFGASLATLIFFATALYYGVFESSVMAVALQAYFPSVPLNLAYLVVILYGIVLIFGRIQTWLDKLNGVLLPIYLIGLAVAVALTIARHGYSNDWLFLQPESGPVADGWWHCYTYYMGVWILMMYTFDYARYGRAEDESYHARFNFGIPFYLVTFLLSGLAGIFLASTLGTTSESGVVISLVQLMGFGGLVFTWVTQTRINTANFHLATTNMHAFFERLLRLRLPHWVWAILVGALAYVIMLADVFSYILQALAYQGVFVVAWVGVALVHILLDPAGTQHMHALTAGSPTAHAFNPGGLIAWFTGTAAGLILMSDTGAASFSAPVTFLVSATVYAVTLRRSAGLRRSSLE